jgi:hypothetical protein
LPNFESFDRSLVVRAKTPTVRIRARGTLSLNVAAFLSLGSPQAVELLFDQVARIIGLRPIDHHFAHPCLMGSSSTSGRGPHVVSVLAFLRYYELHLSQTLRWVPYLDDGVLCVNLDDPAAVPVTSNRSASQRSPNLTVVPDLVSHDTAARQAHQ